MAAVHAEGHAAKNACEEEQSKAPHPGHSTRNLLRKALGVAPAEDALARGQAIPQLRLQDGLLRIDDVAGRKVVLRIGLLRVVLVVYGIGVVDGLAWLLGVDLRWGRRLLVVSEERFVLLIHMQ
jgi:hypothetical protein